MKIKNFPEAIDTLLNCTEISNQTKLDVLDVALCLRSGARILCREGEELVFCKSLLSAFKINYAEGVVSFYLPKLSSTKFNDDFSESGENCEKYIPLYLAKNNEICEVLRESEYVEDDISFGKWLGYPACCVEFVSRRGAVPSLAESFHIYSESGFYNPYIWPASNIFDAALLPHFPCSVNCRQSLDLAKNRWKIVKQNSVLMANEIQIANSLLYYTNDYKEITAVLDVNNDQIPGTARPSMVLS